MNFRGLEYITSIAEHQNLTRAAEVLHTVQPNLSKFLAKFEEELGVKLFQYEDRKYTPTLAGELFLSYARAMLNIKSSLDAELSDIVKHNIGVLNIGTDEMRCSYMFPKIIPEFSISYPNVRVNISDETSLITEEALLSGDIDLAFYSKPHKQNPHIEYETLAREELRLCTCRNHPVKCSARDGHVELSALRDERLILLSPEQRTGQISRYWLKRAGIDLSNSITTNNMPAVISLTELGWGVSFVFESHLKWHSPKPEIDTYSFGDGRVMSDFVAAWRKGGYLSSYAREFIRIAGKLYA